MSDARSTISIATSSGCCKPAGGDAAHAGDAVLGTILVTELRSRVTAPSSPRLSSRHAAAEAAQIGQARGSDRGTAAIPHFIRVDFAHASETVFYVMVGVMACAAVVALVGLPQGVQQESDPLADPVDMKETRDARH